MNAAPSNTGPAPGASPGTGRDAGRDGIAAFYAATYARLVGGLTVACGSRADAEEVVQEAFARLLPRWSTVSAYEDPEAWVRTVAFRLSASRWRRAKVAARGLARLGPPAEVRPPDVARVEAERLLADLPRIYREVLVLHHAFDLSVEQIARELGVPAGTVKSRLSRGRDAAAALGGDSHE